MMVIMLASTLSVVPDMYILVSYNRDDLILSWFKENPVVVDPNVELPQFDFVRVKWEDNIIIPHTSGIVNRDKLAKKLLSLCKFIILLRIFAYYDFIVLSI